MNVHITSVCHKYGLGQNSSIRKGSIIVDKAHKLAFCRNAKVGIDFENLDFISDLGFCIKTNSKYFHYNADSNRGSKQNPNPVFCHGYVCLFALVDVFTKGW